MTYGLFHLTTRGLRTIQFDFVVRCGLSAMLLQKAVITQGGFVNACQCQPRSLAFRFAPFQPLRLPTWVVELQLRIGVSRASFGSSLCSQPGFTSARIDRVYWDLLRGLGYSPCLRERLRLYPNLLSYLDVSSVVQAVPEFSFFVDRGELCPRRGQQSGKSFV